MPARDFASRLAKTHPMIDGGAIAAALPPPLRTESGSCPRFRRRCACFATMVDRPRRGDRHADVPPLPFAPTRASEKAGITEIRRNAAS